MEEYSGQILIHIIQMLYNKKNISSYEGFTLIELIILFTIIAILAAIAVPRTFITVPQAKLASLKSVLDSVRTAIYQHKGLSDAGDPAVPIFENTSASDLVSTFFPPFPQNPYNNNNGICNSNTCLHNGTTCTTCDASSIPINSTYGWVYNPTQPPYFWSYPTDTAFDGSNIATL